MSKSAPNILFLEGPAYAGKTTFLRNLTLPGVIKLPEASEFLGGDANFPEAPHDVRSMLHCTYFFGRMEQLRLESIASAPQDCIVVADRFTPLSSMLFYKLRHEAGAISDQDYREGVPLCAALFQELSTISSDVAFLRFDIAAEEDFEHRLSRGTRNGEFNHWQNFVFQSKLYKELLGDTFEVVTNGSCDISHTVFQSSGILHDLLQPGLYIDKPSQEGGLKIEASSNALSTAEKRKIDKRLKELLHVK